MNTTEKVIIGIVGAVVASVWLKKVRDSGSPLLGGSPPIYGPEQELPPVDAYAPQETTNVFDPTPKPGALAFRAYGIKRWGQRPGSPQNIGRWDKVDKPSEHHEGRAWDLMTNNIAHGDQIVSEVLAPEGDEPDALARRAGVMYMIWNKRIWRAYPYQGSPSGTWASYTGPNPHTDHVHFSFSKAGGAGETSLYQLIDNGLIA